MGSNDFRTLWAGGRDVDQIVPEVVTHIRSCYEYLIRHGRNDVVVVLPPPSSEQCMPQFLMELESGLNDVLPPGAVYGMCSGLTSGSSTSYRVIGGMLRGIHLNAAGWRRYRSYLRGIIRRHLI